MNTSEVNYDSGWVGWWVGDELSPELSLMFDWQIAMCWELLKVAHRQRMNETSQRPGKARNMICIVSRSIRTQSITECVWIICYVMLKLSFITNFNKSCIKLKWYERECEMKVEAVSGGGNRKNLRKRNKVTWIVRNYFGSCLPGSFSYSRIFMMKSWMYTNPNSSPSPSAFRHTYISTYMLFSFHTCRK